MQQLRLEPHEFKIGTVTYNNSKKWVKKNLFSDLVEKNKEYYANMLAFSQNAQMLQHLSVMIASKEEQESINEQVLNDLLYFYSENQSMEQLSASSFGGIFKAGDSGWEKVQDKFAMLQHFFMKLYGVYSSNKGEHERLQKIVYQLVTNPETSCFFIVKRSQKRHDTLSKADTWKTWQDLESLSRDELIGCLHQQLTAYHDSDFLLDRVACEIAKVLSLGSTHKKTNNTAVGRVVDAAQRILTKKEITFDPVEYQARRRVHKVLKRSKYLATPAAYKPLDDLASSYDVSRQPGGRYQHKVEKKAAPSDVVARTDARRWNELLNKAESKEKIQAVITSFIKALLGEYGSLSLGGARAVLALQHIFSVVTTENQSKEALGQQLAQIPDMDEGELVQLKLTMTEYLGDTDYGIYLTKKNDKGELNKGFPGPKEHPEYALDSSTAENILKCGAKYDLSLAQPTLDRLDEQKNILERKEQVLHLLADITQAYQLGYKAQYRAAKKQLQELNLTDAFVEDLGVDGYTTARDVTKEGNFNWASILFRRSTKGQNINTKLTEVNNELLQLYKQRIALEVQLSSTNEEISNEVNCFQQLITRGTLAEYVSWSFLAKHLDLVDAQLPVKEKWIQSFLQQYDQLQNKPEHSKLVVERLFVSAFIEAVESKDFSKIDQLIMLYEQYLGGSALSKSSRFRIETTINEKIQKEKELKIIHENLEIIQEELDKCKKEDRDQIMKQRDQIMKQHDQIMKQRNQIMEQHDQIMQPNVALTHSYFLLTDLPDAVKQVNAMSESVTAEQAQRVCQSLRAIAKMNLGAGTATDIKLKEVIKTFFKKIKNILITESGLADSKLSGLYELYARLDTERFDVESDIDYRKILLTYASSEDLKQYYKSLGSEIDRYENFSIILKSLPKSERLQFVKENFNNLNESHQKFHFGTIVEELSQADLSQADLFDFGVESVCNMIDSLSSWNVERKCIAFDDSLTDAMCEKISGVLRMSANGSAEIPQMSNDIQFLLSIRSKGIVDVVADPNNQTLLQGLSSERKIQSITTLLLNNPMNMTYVGFKSLTVGLTPQDWGRIQKQVPLESFLTKINHIHDFNDILDCYNSWFMTESGTIQIFKNDTQEQILQQGLGPYKKEVNSFNAICNGAWNEVTKQDLNAVAEAIAGLQGEWASKLHRRVQYQLQELIQKELPQFYLTSLHDGNKAKILDNILQQLESGLTTSKKAFITQVFKYFLYSGPVLNGYRKVAHDVLMKAFTGLPAEPTPCREQYLRNVVNLIGESFSTYSRQTQGFLSCLLNYLPSGSYQGLWNTVVTKLYEKLTASTQSLLYLELQDCPELKEKLIYYIVSYENREPSNIENFLKQMDTLLSYGSILGFHSVVNDKVLDVLRGFDAKKLYSYAYGNQYQNMQHVAKMARDALSSNEECFLQAIQKLTAEDLNSDDSLELFVAYLHIKTAGLGADGIVNRLSTLCDESNDSVKKLALRYFSRVLREEKIVFGDGQEYELTSSPEKYQGFVKNYQVSLCNILKASLTDHAKHPELTTIWSYLSEIINRKDYLAQVSMRELLEKLKKLKSTESSLAIFQGIISAVASQKNYLPLESMQELLEQLKKSESTEYSLGIFQGIISAVASQIESLQELLEQLKESRFKVEQLKKSKSKENSQVVFQVLIAAVTSQIGMSLVQQPNSESMDVIQYYVDELKIFLQNAIVGYLQKLNSTDFRYYELIRDALFKADVTADDILEELEQHEDSNVQEPEIFEIDMDMSASVDETDAPQAAERPTPQVDTEVLSTFRDVIVADLRILTQVRETTKQLQDKAKAKVVTPEKLKAFSEFLHELEVAEQNSLIHYKKDTIIEIKSGIKKHLDRAEVKSYVRAKQIQTDLEEPASTLGTDSLSETRGFFEKENLLYQQHFDTLKQWHENTQELLSLQPAADMSNMIMPLKQAMQGLNGLLDSIGIDNIICHYNRAEGDVRMVGLSTKIVQTIICFVTLIQQLAVTNNNMSPFGSWKTRKATFEGFGFDFDSVSSEKTFNYVQAFAQLTKQNDDMNMIWDRDLTHNQKYKHNDVKKALLNLRDSFVHVSDALYAEKKSVFQQAAELISVDTVRVVDATNTQELIDRSKSSVLTPRQRLRDDLLDLATFIRRFEESQSKTQVFFDTYNIIVHEKNPAVQIPWYAQLPRICKTILDYSEKTGQAIPEPMQKFLNNIKDYALTIQKCPSSGDRSELDDLLSYDTENPDRFLASPNLLLLAKRYKLESALTDSEGKLSDGVKCSFQTLRAWRVWLDDMSNDVALSKQPNASELAAQDIQLGSRRSRSSFITIGTSSSVSVLKEEDHVLQKTDKKIKEKFSCFSQADIHRRSDYNLSYYSDMQRTLTDALLSAFKDYGDVFSSEEGMRTLSDMYQEYFKSLDQGSEDQCVVGPPTDRERVQPKPLNHPDSIEFTLINGGAKPTMAICISQDIINDVVKQHADFKISSAQDSVTFKTLAGKLEKMNTSFEELFRDTCFTQVQIANARKALIESINKQLHTIKVSGITVRLDKTSQDISIAAIDKNLDDQIHRCHTSYDDMKQNFEILKVLSATAQGEYQTPFDSHFSKTYFRDISAWEQPQTTEDKVGYLSNLTAVVDNTRKAFRCFQQVKEVMDALSLSPAFKLYLCQFGETREDHQDEIFRQYMEKADQSFAHQKDTQSFVSDYLATFNSKHTALNKEINTLLKEINTLLKKWSKPKTIKRKKENVRVASIETPGELNAQQILKQIDPFKKLRKATFEKMSKENKQRIIEELNHLTGVFGIFGFDSGKQNMMIANSLLALGGEHTSEEFPEKFLEESAQLRHTLNTMRDNKMQAVQQLLTGTNKLNLIVGIDKSVISALSFDSLERLENRLENIRLLSEHVDCKDISKEKITQSSVMSRQLMFLEKSLYASLLAGLFGISAPDRGKFLEVFATETLHLHLLVEIHDYFNRLKEQDADVWAYAQHNWLNEYLLSSCEDAQVVFENLKNKIVTRQSLLATIKAQHISIDDVNSKKNGELQQKLRDKQSKQSSSVSGGFSLFGQKPVTADVPLTAADFKGKSLGWNSVRTGATVFKRVPSLTTTPDVRTKIGQPPLIPVPVC